MRPRKFLRHAGKWTLTLLAASVLGLWGVSMARDLARVDRTRLLMLHAWGGAVLLAWVPATEGVTPEEAAYDFNLTETRYKIMTYRVAWRFQAWWPQRPSYRVAPVEAVI